MSAYEVLTRHGPSADLGGTYFDQRHRTTVAARLVRRREQRGLTVTIAPFAPAAARA